jgi:hypothetical protein
MTIPVMMVVPVACVQGSEGLKLALVHHLDMPIMRQKGFHIAPGLYRANYFRAELSKVDVSEKVFITLVFSVYPFSHGGFPVSCLTAVGHMRQSHKGNIGEIKDSLGVCVVHFYA